MRKRSLILMIVALAVGIIAACAVMRLFPGFSPSGGGLSSALSSDDYYAMIREGLAEGDGRQALRGAEGLAALRPESYAPAMNLCLLREYFAHEGEAGKACYARAAALCGRPPFDDMTAFDHALLLTLAGDPGAADAAEAYAGGVPVPDAEYFKEIVNYDRSRLVRQLLRPLGALP